jgi:hypothetical protein
LPMTSWSVMDLLADHGARINHAVDAQANAGTAQTRPATTAMNETKRTAAAVNNTVSAVANHSLLALSTVAAADTVSLASAAGISLDMAVFPRGYRANRLASAIPQAENSQATR